MPAVKKLKIDGSDNAHNKSENETLAEHNDTYIKARTFCSFHLRPKKGLDRYVCVCVCSKQLKERV